MDQNEQIVIRTQNLGKRYGAVQALDGVDLVVPKHSIFGFLGPNGAGKTTLMKILLGLSRPTAGSATIFGQDIASDSLAIRERIGYLPQHPRFIETMTARENLEYTAQFFFKGPKGGIQQRCAEMLELVGLEDKADRLIKGFSGGEKQRLGIALAQVNYPDLLILDEPASALDPLGRQAVLEVMDRLRKYTTIFYSTHILDDVQRVSDTVAILNRGKLITSGPIEGILNGRDGVMYTVGLKHAAPGLDQRLKQLPWVIGARMVQRNGIDLWEVAVSDEAEAQSQLLRFVLSDQEIMVTEFNRKKHELEEVFVEIVKGDSDEC